MQSIKEITEDPTSMLWMIERPQPKPGLKGQIIRTSYTHFSPDIYQIHATVMMQEIIHATKDDAPDHRSISGFRERFGRYPVRDRDMKSESSLKGRATGLIVYYNPDRWFKTFIDHPAIYDFPINFQVISEIDIDYEGGI